MKSFAFVATAATLALATLALAQELPPVDPAIAGMSNDELVAARQDAMKEDGRVLRGAAQATGDEAVAIATTVLQNFVDFPALFREGSLTADSDAQPAVWEQWDKFEGIFLKGQTIAAQMLAAAQSGDTATYGKSIEALGGLCFECHQTFRARD
jgi:cytochrome c556